MSYFCNPALTSTDGPKRSPMANTVFDLGKRVDLESTVDIVVPVYNEERSLATSVRRLDSYLAESFPFRYCITVADNASTDATWPTALALAAELPRVRAVHLAEKGRGGALTAVWLSSAAPVLAYLDVDLSTDLRALLPLVAPLISGHSDLAIGTRLASASRVVRAAKREFISRGYNLLLRTTLAASFSDAQCGFKAIRADVAARLLPVVEDTSWFFDTELLLWAQRIGLRIHEVPVDWTDDPDSRVELGSTVKEDLRGIVRLARGFSTGQLPLARLQAEFGRDPAYRSARPRVTRNLLPQLLSFGVIGLLSTLAYLACYLALREIASAQLANLVALLLTAIANTAANRRLTFNVTGAPGWLKHHVGGLLVFGLGLLLTSSALAALHQFATSPGRLLEVLVLGVANGLVSLLRFFALRRLLR